MANQHCQSTGGKCRYR